MFSRIPMRSVSTDKMSDDPEEGERIQMDETDSAAGYDEDTLMDGEDFLPELSPTKRAAGRRRKMMPFDLRTGAGIMPRCGMLMKNPAVLMSLLAGLLILIIYLSLPRSSGSETETRKSKYSSLTPFTFDDVNNFELRPTESSIRWVHGAKDGTFIEKKGDSILLKHIVDKKNVTMLVKVEDIRDGKGMPVLFTDFKLSTDLKYLLLEADVQKGWRHSYFATYWIHDIADKMSSPLQISTPKETGDDLGSGKISLALWSPTGHTVAWIRDNDVYVTIDTKNEIKITNDGSKNIINGLADWVYEEEVLSTQEAMWFSPDAKHLAFLKFNDTLVPEIQLQMFATKESYPKNIRLKYPKAGSPNPVVTLHIATPAETKASLRVAEVAFPSESMYPDDDRLITEVKWLSDTTLLARLMNRVQDSQRLFHVKFTEEGIWQVQMVREEEHEDEAWFPALQPITVIPPSTAIGRMEPSYLELKEDERGYTHIAYFSSVLQSKPASWLTTGPYEVTSIDAVDHQTGTVYFTSTEESSTQRHLYAVQLDGTGKKKLTPLTKGIDWGASVRTYNTTRPKSKESQGTFTLSHSSDDGIGDEVGTIGYYESSFSPEGNYCLLSYKGPDVPFQAIVKLGGDAETGATMDLLNVIEKNEDLHKALRGFASPREMFLTVPVPSLDPNLPPIEVNVKLQVPIDFDASGNKKYPMLVKVYGGPGSQLVKQTFDMGFETGVAAAGFIVATVDPRGTGFRGRAFRSIVSKELGNYESHDVVEVAKGLIEKGFVDDKKIAVWGWSYGGYLTSKIVERNSGVFAVGMAVAPVTDWRYYVHLQNSAMLIWHLTGAKVRKYRSQFFTDSDHSIYAGGANSEVYALLWDYMVEKMNVKLPKPVPKKPPVQVVRREEEWLEIV
ncbi:hypothetical protein HDU67_006703 [Dinochytrium kinnereticum]|nr:hypothetical protein HDU67_006703 [Dinochytrium kinnereticum]